MFRFALVSRMSRLAVAALAVGAGLTVSGAALAQTTVSGAGSTFVQPLLIRWNQD